MDSIGEALLKALEPTIRDYVAQEVEKRLATLNPPDGKQVLGFQDVHTRYGVSREAWNEALSSGRVRGIARKMRGGKTGYVVPLDAAARAWGGAAGSLATALA